MTFPGEITCNIQICNRDPLHWIYSITRSSRKIELSNLWSEETKDEIRVLPNDGGEGEPILYDDDYDDNFYTMQIKAVHSFIMSGAVEASSPSMTWDDSISNMKVLDKWRKAINLSFPADSD